MDCQFDKTLAASELAGHRTKGFFGSSFGVAKLNNRRAEKNVNMTIRKNSGGR